MFSSVTFLKAVYMIEKAKYSDKIKLECKYYFQEHNVCLLKKKKKKQLSFILVPRPNCFLVQTMRIG